MKHTIIECDLCNGRICTDGWFKEVGAVKLRVKVLEEKMPEFPSAEKFASWKRSTLYICPKCVDKIKEVCNGGKTDVKDT